jgi:hypothetical protein
MLLVSCVLMTIFIFIVGGLTKGEAVVLLPREDLVTNPSQITVEFGSGSTNTSGIYGTVASIFLFQGSYAIGITPLTLLYPPEILNYAIRANGMAAWTMTTTLAA